MSRIVLDKQIVALQSVVDRRRLPVGIHDVQVEVLEGEFDYLLARLSAYVLGKKGKTCSTSEQVIVPKWPRWMPKRLQRRWTQTATVTLDATPFLAYPELEIGALPGGDSPVELFINDCSWWNIK